jgi:hypothetical protein
MSVEFITSESPEGQAAKEIAKGVTVAAFKNQDSLVVSMTGLAIAIAMASRVVARDDPRGWINEIHKLALLILEQQETGVTVQ